VVHSFHDISFGSGHCWDVKKSGLRFHYYHCSFKSKKVQCTERSFIRDGKLADEVKRNAELVIIPDEWKERFLARIETWESEVSKEKQEKIERLKSEQVFIKAKLDRINNAFAEGALGVDEFKELKNPLIPQKASLEQEIVALELSKANRLEPLRNWVLQANTAPKAVLSKDFVEMKSFLLLVGSNRLLRAQTLTVSFKKPFDCLAKTTIATRNTSDESERCIKWWRRRELNPRPRRKNQPRLHV
jgi:hypothetical protein